MSRSAAPEKLRMPFRMHFHKNVLEIDAEAEANRLADWLRQAVRGQLRRRGCVVGISGGVDSAVVLGLCARAFGPGQVLALMLPDRDSSPESERLARLLAARFGVEPLLEDVTKALDGFGCYGRRDEAIRRLFPEYDPAAGYLSKIVLPPDLLEGDTLNVFSVTIVRPDGSEASLPLPTAEFLQIVAASNFKQRARMAMLYFHAELRHFAVIGTANKNERQQGFFVKHGDAGVDCDPIVYLYKTQVYQLAEHLGVPEEIRRRTPTSDTYSAPCSQEEFFFRLPFATMDLLWWAHENGVTAAEASEVVGLRPEQVERAFADFASKQRATEPLRQPPLAPSPALASKRSGMRSAKAADCLAPT
jgi:NAD+ synthase